MNKLPELKRESVNASFVFTTFVTYDPLYLGPIIGSINTDITFGNDEFSRVLASLVGRRITRMDIVAAPRGGALSFTDLAALSDPIFYVVDSNTISDDPTPNVIVSGIDYPSGVVLTGEPPGIIFSCRVQNSTGGGAGTKTIAVVCSVCIHYI